MGLTKAMDTKRWVFVLFCNTPFLKRAFKTIRQAQSIGQWKDDIVLLVSQELFKNERLQVISKQLNIILREIPERNFDSIMNIWKKNSQHKNYVYAMTRPFIYNKFHIFDIYFKQWDIVFYLDAGAEIQGPLERMKQACIPTNLLYAHSNGYPNYEWKLSNEFDLTLFENEENKKVFIDTYSPFFDRDYFQSTLCIYDTKIIEPDTVTRLFELSEKYPIALHMDQGILNLYFNCERNLWKQIPVSDSIGLLYDYHERDGHLTKDYLIIKYGHTII